MSQTSKLCAFQSQVTTAPRRSATLQWGSSCLLPKIVIVGLLLRPFHLVLGTELEPWAFGMPTAYSLCPRTLVSSSLNKLGAGKIAQLVGALAVKPDNLRSIPSLGAARRKERINSHELPSDLQTHIQIDYK